MVSYFREVKNQKSIGHSSGVIVLAFLNVGQVCYYAIMILGFLTHLGRYGKQFLLPDAPLAYSCYLSKNNEIGNKTSLTYKRYP